MSLAIQTQQDFSLGMCPGIAPHLIPGNGVAKMVNFLVDEDGSLYKRSGASAKSAAFGTTGLTFLWDGWLAGGQRTVLANTDDFGVLAADDTAVVNLGGTGLDAPAGAVEIAGILFIDGGYVYGGSRLTATYSTGTLKATATDNDGAPGLTTVVGTGTSWAANLDAGMLLVIAGGVYAVASVTDDTHLELAVPFPGGPAKVQSKGQGVYIVTVTGASGGTLFLTIGDDDTAAFANNATAATVQTAVQATTLGAGATVAGAAGGPWTITLANDTDVLVNGNDLALTYAASPLLLAADAGVPTADIYASISGRLVACIGNRAKFSAPLNPSSFADTDYHELTDGVRILGAQALGGNLIVFTTAGLWVIQNMAYDLVSAVGDIQQPELREMRDLVLWSQAGMAAWQETLVVPAIDGVWLVTSTSARLVTRSIAPLYASYVQQGFSTGIAAVYRSHFELPILDKQGRTVDLLVCRLDRPTQVRGQEMWPWSVMRGAGAKLTAIAVRVGITTREPLLLGAEQTSGSRVLTLGEFEHDGLPNDQDDSPVIPELIWRDIATGGTSTNHLKKFELRYELVDPDTDPALPKVRTYYATSARPPVATWGAFVWGFDHWQDPDDDELGFTVLDKLGPQSTGETPERWLVNKRVRFARMRIKLEGGATRFVIRHSRLFIRPSGRM